jgi:hypothetical protein
MKVFTKNVDKSLHILKSPKIKQSQLKSTSSFDEPEKVHRSWRKLELKK